MRGREEAEFESFFGLFGFGFGVCRIIEGFVGIGIDCCGEGDRPVEGSEAGLQLRLEGRVCFCVLLWRGGS